MTENLFLSESGKSEISLERIFDASRKLLWKAWTDCDLVTQWWGPKGFTAPFCMNDLRVGGKYLYCMRGSEGMGIWSGKEIWSTGVYREVVPFERIVCTDSFADEKGNVVPATHYGMNADFPLEMLLTVTFEENEDKAKLKLLHVGFPSVADRDGARIGWGQSLDKLVEILKDQKKKY